MKYETAIQIIRNEYSKGFMVSFEWYDGRILKSDHFPDKHAGEELIKTEEEAWHLAADFAKATEKGLAGKNIINIYVINYDFTPVENCKIRMIRSRK